MKVAIYCRVSTEAQYSKGVSIQDQKQRGIEFCIEHNYDYEVFEELATSGTKPIAERPKLFELLKRTEKQKTKIKDVFEPPEFQGLYIVDFDRVSRDEEQFPVIKHHFIENDIIIFDKGQRVNLRDAETSLMVSIKGSLAAYEIAKMKERIKRSLERSVIDGKAGGGAILNYGYRKGENKLLVIDEQEAEVVKLIYDMCLKDYGTKVIANELNTQKIPTKRNNSKKGKLKIRGKVVKEFIWRDSTVYRILSNSIYCGERLFKGKIYNSPAIIDKKVFDLAQEKLKERKHYVNTTNKHSYLLKGLIICPICKNLFYGRKREDLSDNQYCCSSQRYSEYCGNRGVNIDKIDGIVWNSILDLPKKIKSIIVDKNDEYVESLKTEIQTSKQLLMKFELEKGKFVKEILRNEKLSLLFEKDLDELASKIEAEAKVLQEKERQLEMSNQHGTLIETLQKQVKPLKNKNLSFEERLRIVRSFILFVIVKWSETRGEHLIWTQFRLSELSDLNIQGLSKISYKKLGFHYKTQKVAFEFRVGSLRPMVEVMEDGSRKFTFDDSVEDGFFTVEDFTEKEYESFKELIWKARKRKGIPNYTDKES
jgi:DNA invertase Pin-like site-specific DNA recombinase